MRRKDRDGWPTDLDLEHGWIRTADRVERARPARAARTAPGARRSIAEVLKEAAQVAGCTVAEVKAREMGPGANPARRLAVWALSRAQVYSHREIATTLGMSEGQVAKVLWHLRRRSAPPLRTWMEALAARQVESGRS
jgi:hypothetical protein